MQFYVLAHQELLNITKNPFSDDFDHNIIGYMLVTLRIVHGFLNRYYDPTTFRTEEKEIANPDSTDFVLTSDNIRELLSDLFSKIRALYDLKSPFLRKEDSMLIYEAAHTLSLLVSDANIADLEHSKAEDENAENRIGEDEEYSQNEHETMILQRFDEFKATLNADANLNETIREESVQFVRVLESIPFLSDDGEHQTDLRYEPFIKKLVSHVYESLEMVNSEKYLNPRCTRSTKWMMTAFRVVIENRWGKTIYDRDEDGGEEDDIASAPVVEAFNSCGVTTLCIDLIGIGIDESLQVECIKLLIAMLFKEGGAHMVQETVYQHIMSIESRLFFLQIRKFLQSLIEWHKWNEGIVLEDGQDPEFKEFILIIRCWQLLSEGHFRPNQNITREQPSNVSSINLLDDFVLYLTYLSRNPCRTSTDAALRLSATILEVLQGPCEQSQTYLALNTDILETMNRILRSKTPSDGVVEQELELKTTIIDIFRGLLEGQPSKSAVYDRLISVLHFDILQNIINPIVVEDEEAFKAVKDDESDEVLALRVQCLVLLESLCDYAPHLRSELSMGEIPADVGCVEVMWNGMLQRRFFHIPEICWFLAESSKQNLVFNVHRNSVESKLHDFLDRAKGLYTEIKHQQLLTSLNLSKIFSITIMDRVTWFSFSLVFVINCLFLWYYTVVQPPMTQGLEDDFTETYAMQAYFGNPFMPSQPLAAKNALNILLIISASFTVLLVFVVKVPVLYEHFKEQAKMHGGKSEYRIWFSTLTDATVLYYFIYLVVAVVGYAGYDYWISFLLLDILVKDPVAGSVLQAVIRPRSQIVMTLVLMIFFCYIFAFFKVKYTLSSLYYNMLIFLKYAVRVLYGGTGSGKWLDRSGTCLPNIVKMLYFFCRLRFKVRWWCS